jgi:DNA-binding GntR family transcriptional regulator
LEGLAAQLAVQRRANEEEITRMRELHQLLREAYQKRDLERYFEANSSFHRFIDEVTGIGCLYHLIRRIA